MTFDISFGSHSVQLPTYPAAFTGIEEMLRTVLDEYYLYN